MTGGLACEAIAKESSAFFDTGVPDSQKAFATCPAMRVRVMVMASIQRS